MNYIVVDIESERMVQNWSRPHEAGISVVCAWVERKQQYRFYDYHSLGKLARESEKADVIVSWNGVSYDLPVLTRFEPGIEVKEHVDLCAEVKRVVGYKVSLEKCARATLGQGKSGHGKHAPELWERREYASLYNYNQDDVQLTRDLFLFVRKHGFLVVFEKDGRTRRIVELQHLAEEGKYFKVNAAPKRCTPAQLAKLKELSGREWPSHLSRDQASAEIQRLEF